VSYLRRISTRSLIVLVVCVVALAVGGAAIAVAAGGGGPTPSAKPLDQAIHDALAAKPADGVTARIRFTNKLFPSGALLGQAGSALMSGASGRLWVADDGTGRMELQSDSGDVQIVWSGQIVSVYDASSNTVYRATLPAHDNTSTDKGTPSSLADIDRLLTDLGVHWALSEARPTDVAGRPAYSVSASPKHDGGLLGSLELAWDAAHGTTPLRAAIYAQGESAPVLELAVTDISYRPVSSADVDVAPPADAKVVDLGARSPADKGSSTPAVTGLDAVRAAAGFPVVAPDTLVGLPRRDVRLVGGKESPTVLVVYGEGLGAIVVVERRAEPGNAQNGMLSSLPKVSLDGLTGHELATQLGTILEWQRDGVAFVLAGSVPPAAAETAARDLR
jgi:outer membrane lipoprotein-sorting protein